ncbi:MAG: hypothetical protein P1P87_02640 [Trueperaceae bacterium]|nr:hypothetical protein [Trueperaceae bacterium]
MIEDSVEGFVARWRAHAVRATAFARAEGSPLLELEVGGAVVQTLERTGPYAAPAGAIRVILHAVTERFEPVEPFVGAERHLHAVGLAAVEVQGPVLERDGPVAVLDAGVPIVVGLDPGATFGQVAGAPGVAMPAVGAWVRCVGLAPAQAFVLPPERTRVDQTPTDELV